MKLQKLVLKNVRSYSDAVIEFPNGSLLIAGDIGSGKSTILKAVEFALFGTIKGVIDGNDILRKGCKNAEVRLDFSIGSNRYSILRTIKNGVQGAGYIIINDVKEELMPTELRVRVLALLGYPNPDVFRYTVYASQEQMKTIILEKPEERLDTLRLIFGIDKYKKVITSAEIISAKVRQECTFMEGQVVDLSKKEEDLVKISSDFIEIEKKISDYKVSLDLKKDLFSVAEKDYLAGKENIVQMNLKKQKLVMVEKSIVDGNLELEVLTKKKIDVEKSLLQLEKDIASIVIENYADAKEVSLKYQDLSRMVANNKLQLSTLSNKKVMIEKELSAITPSNLDYYSQIQNLVSELELLENEIQDIILAEKELNECDKLLSQNQVLITSHKSQEEAISKLDLCPVCQQNVDDEHKIHISKTVDDAVSPLLFSSSQLRLRIGTLKIKVLALEPKKKKKEELFINKVQLESKLNEDKAKLSRIEEYKKELLVIASKLNIISKFDFVKEEQNLLALQEMLKKIQINDLNLQKKKMLSENLVKDKVRVLEYVKTIDALSGKLVIYAGDKKLLVGELAKLNLMVLDFAIVDKKYVDSRKEFDSANILFETARKEKQLLEKNYSVLRTEVEDKRKIKLKLEWNYQLRSWISEFFINLMETIEKNILLEIYYEFNRNFSEWFDILIEDDSLKVSVDNQFTPIIRQNEFDMEISTLSGGERTSVALAYRLALNRIVNKLISDIKTSDVLILDEPTEGFSTEQLDRVRVVLDMLEVSQLVIVSHEPKIESFVNDVLIVEKEGSVSRVHF